MIYLRKYNNDQPINSYPNLYDYLHNKMESVNDYCSRIKKEPFSKELNEDISWHLYQLMDIFCNEIKIDELYNELCEFLEKSPYQAPDEYVDLQPNFDFRDYFSREECGKERKDWWNYPLEYRDEFI